MLYQLSYVRAGAQSSRVRKSDFRRGAGRRHARRMRRPAAVIGLFLVCCAAACTLRRQVAPASPYCRGGNPLAGVYHPSRLRVKSRCRVAVGTVSKVVFEPYDGDVHIDLRLDPGYESLLSDGNDRVGGNLVVEVIPFDRSRVAVPERGRADRGRRALGRGRPARLERDPPGLVGQRRPDRAGEPPPSSAPCSCSCRANATDSS